MSINAIDARRLRTNKANTYYRELTIYCWATNGPLRINAKKHKTTNKKYANMRKKKQSFSSSAPIWLKRMYVRFDYYKR